MVWFFPNCHCFYIAGGFGSDGTECSSSLLTNFESWHFLVMTFDQSTGFLKIYQLQEGATEFTETKVYDVSAITLEDTNADINIGRRPIGTQNDKQITAKFYCFQIFRSYFTIAEAEMLLNQCD